MIKKLLDKFQDAAETCGSWENSERPMSSDIHAGHMEKVAKLRGELERTIEAMRDERQKAVYKWGIDTFGTANGTALERAMRFLEEALELAQAEGIPTGRVDALMRHVYARPAGEPFQEAGGVGVCLLAYCEARGFSADKAEADETARVMAIDPEYFRKRHDAKAAAGIAARTGNL